jgi:hypothetical protein
MQIQYGRSLGILSITFGLLLPGVQLLLWSRITEVLVEEPRDPAPRVASMFVVGGIVLFSSNFGNLRTFRCNHIPRLIARKKAF